VLGAYPLADVLKESMRSFNAPPSLSQRYPVLYNNQRAKETLDAFMTKAARVSAFICNACQLMT